MDKIPDFVAAMIERKKISIKDDELKREMQQQAEREDAIDSGKLTLAIRIAEDLEKVPEWIRIFGITDQQASEDDLYLIGKGHNIYRHLLEFQIPGLANIRCDLNRGDGPWWIAPCLWDVNDRPELSYKFSDWHRDLEYVLILAESAAGDLAKARAEYDRQCEEDARREAEREAKEAAQVEAEAEALAADEERLLDALKRDPMALHLLKTFVMVREERGRLEDRLAEAYDAAETMEGIYGRKIADLRAQNSDAERRAEEERDRASRIQDDLDEAEEKIKKAQRGW